MRVYITLQVWRTKSTKGYPLKRKCGHSPDRKNDRTWQTFTSLDSAASHGAREVLVTSSCDILCDNQGGFVTIFGRRDYVVIGE
jgi:hypothetical protein